MIRSVSTIGLLAALSLVVATVHAQSYSITDLGVVGTSNMTNAKGLNNTGKACMDGWVDGRSPEHALFFDGSRLNVLPDFGGGQSECHWINDAGWVVGRALNKPGYYRACVWRNGTITDLTGKNNSTAFAANSIASPQITGIISTRSGGNAFLWQNGKYTTLPFHCGYSINNAGQIAGLDTDSSGNSNLPLFWSSTTGSIYLDNGPDQNGLARSINASGQIAGQIGTRDPLTGGWSWEAVVWNGPAGTISYHLGTLDANGTMARSINDSGVVVGYPAFIWDSTNGIRDVNTLVGSATWTIDEAVSINNSGQILATAHTAADPNHGHAVLLTPQ